MATPDLLLNVGHSERVFGSLVLVSLVIDFDILLACLPFLGTTLSRNLSLALLFGFLSTSLLLLLHLVHLIVIQGLVSAADIRLVGDHVGKVQELIDQV